MVFWGAVGHAVSTFPTPKNPYGQWFLGTLQWLVGQRIQAQQTITGQANINALATAVIPSPPPGTKVDVIAESK
jgi:hypothetical protein